MYSPAADIAACPTESEIEEAVRAQLGYDPFSRTAAITVVCTVARQDQSLDATVVVIDEGGKPRGHRELHAGVDECRQLGRALALSISIAIDPERANSLPDGPLPDTVKESAVVTTESVEPKTTSPAVTPPRRELRVAVPNVEQRPRNVGPKRTLEPFLGLFAVSSAGLAPTLSLGAALGTGVRHGNVGIGLEAHATLPAREELMGGASYSVRLFNWALLPCVHLHAWEACAVGLAGAMSVRSYGIERASSDTGLYAAVGTRVGYELSLSPQWMLAAHLDARATLLRPSVQFEGAQVWQSPPFSGSIGLGVISHFP